MCYYFLRDNTLPTSERKKIMDQYERVDQYYKARFMLFDHFHSKVKDEVLAIEATLIVVLKMQKNQEISRDSLLTFLNDADFNQDATEVISSTLTDHWSFVLSFVDKFNNEPLEDLFDECFEIKPRAGFYQLVSELLHIEKNDHILEFFCGYASFPVCINRKKISFNEYTGIEPEYNSKDISILKTSSLNGSYNFIVDNPIDYHYSEKYDKIISNYPLDLSGQPSNKIREDIQNKFHLESSVVSKCSYDWVRVAEAVYYLKDTGRAVVIVNNVSAYNKPDYYMRKFFLENGYIEKVINLPASLYTEKNISATLLILSHNNNTSVRLVNAQNSDLKDYKEIIEMLHNSNDYSYDITPQKMYDHDYNLLASHYLEQPEIENGVPLETLIKSIKRGSQLNVRSLVTPDNAVNTYTISLSNISNGLIEFVKDQECITVPDDYLKNHIISKNHMVISKMAAPTFKTAIYNNENDKPVMASGNLFVIEFDENKVNPYYVQAYFDSEAGEAAIQYAAGGTTSKSISMDAIKKVIIPLTSLEKQNQIADEYQKALSEYTVLKNEIQMVIDRKRNLL